MSLNKPAAGQAELTGRNVPKLKAHKVSFKKKWVWLFRWALSCVELIWILMRFISTRCCFVFYIHFAALLPAVMEIRSKVGVHQEARGPFSQCMELLLLLLLVPNLSIYLLNGPRGVYGNSYLNTRPPTATHYRLVYQGCSQKRRN